MAVPRAALLPVDGADDRIEVSTHLAKCEAAADERTAGRDDVFDPHNPEPDNRAVLGHLAGAVHLCLFSHEHCREAGELSLDPPVR